MDTLPFLIIVLLGASCCHGNSLLDELLDELQDTKSLPEKKQLSDDQSAELNELRETVASLARQTMMQQTYIEESTRGGINSGLKQRRVMRWGTKPYDTDSHTGDSMMSIHNHEDHISTMGMGEFIAVLNGIEFRTRHNDFKFNMPHSTSKEYHATEPIPFPEVPPSVLQQATVEDQIIEMQKYFKAWADQDPSEYDYLPYFKPVICYLEGAWTNSTGDIDEPYESDRHSLNAKTWSELFSKIEFTGNTGHKDMFEDYAYLPTKIIELKDGIYPVFGQWNYRILCNPLKDDLPLKQFRLVDDLGARLSERKTLDEFYNARAARFELNPKTVDDVWIDNKDHYGLLDELMSQIPGKDNHAGNLTDNAFNNVAYPYDNSVEGPLNTAYYHRWYRYFQNGASGQAIRNRGFADKNIFMAQTSQEKILSSKVSDCKTRGRNEVCDHFDQKWTYAIPMEIIYMTPLLSWNPYDLEYKTGDLEDTVTADGRNGGSSTSRAFDGTRYDVYYRTPSEFYNGVSGATSSADTAKGSVGVLDKNGEVKMVTASGTRVVMPNIPDVGELRTRFPIAPITSDGSYPYQELAALKDIVLNMQSYADMVNEEVVEGDGEGPSTYLFETTETAQDPPGLHHHTLEIGLQDFTAMVEENKEVEFETSLNNGHTHSILVAYKSKNSKFVITAFDGSPVTDDNRNSWDGHRPILIHVTD